MPRFEWFGRVSLHVDGPAAWAHALGPLALCAAPSEADACRWHIDVLGSPADVMVAEPPDPFSSTVTVRADPSFEAAALSELVNELLFLKWIQAGILPVHAAAMRVDGRGYLLPARPGTGKTALLLWAARERQGEMVADEWSLVADGQVHAARSYMRLMSRDVERFARFVGLGPVERMRASIAPRSRCVDPRRWAPDYGKPATLNEVVYLERCSNGASGAESLQLADLIDEIWACFARERVALRRLLTRAHAAREDGADPWPMVEQAYRSLAERELRQPCRRLRWSAADDEAVALRLVRR